MDALTDAAGAAAGSADVNLKQDSGFMCGRSFENVDGHIWEAICVDMSFHFHLIWRGLSKRQFTHFGKLRTGFDKLRACPGPDPGASGQHADSFRGEPVEPWAESAHGDRFA
ncbi:MAG: hypothetical protein ACREPH_05775 [Rhodanobacteraceae bacterium]